MEERCGDGNWEEAAAISREMGRKILRCNNKAANAAVRDELGWKRLGAKQKIRRHRTIKTDLSLEKYLLAKNNPQGRKILTALRIGSYPLRIETERSYPRLPEEERQCLKCMSGSGRGETLSFGMQ